MLLSLQRGSKHFSNLEHSFHGGRTSDWSGASGGQIGRLKYTVQFDYIITILHTAEEHPGKGPGKKKIFLLLLNPPSNNAELQKIIAKHMHDCYETRKNVNKS